MFYYVQTQIRMSTLYTFRNSKICFFRKSLKSTNPEAKLDIEHHTYSTVDYSTMSDVRSEYYKYHFYFHLLM